MRGPTCAPGHSLSGASPRKRHSQRKKTPRTKKHTGPLGLSQTSFELRPFSLCMRATYAWFVASLRRLPSAHTGRSSQRACNMLLTRYAVQRPSHVFRVSKATNPNPSSSHVPTAWLCSPESACTSRFGHALHPEKTAMCNR